MFHGLIKTPLKTKTESKSQGKFFEVKFTRTENILETFWKPGILRRVNRYCWDRVSLASVGLFSHMTVLPHILHLWICICFVYLVRNMFPKRVMSFSVLCVVQDVLQRTLIMVLKTECLIWNKTFQSLHLKEGFQTEQTDLVIPKVWSKPCLALRSFLKVCSCLFYNLHLVPDEDKHLALKNSYISRFWINFSCRNCLMYSDLFH